VGWCEEEAWTVRWLVGMGHHMGDYKTGERGSAHILIEKKGMIHTLAGSFMSIHAPSMSIPVSGL